MLPSPALTVAGRTAGIRRCHRLEEAARQRRLEASMPGCSECRPIPLRTSCLTLRSACSAWPAARRRPGRGRGTPRCRSRATPASCRAESTAAPRTHRAGARPACCRRVPRADTRCGEEFVAAQPPHPAVGRHRLAQPLGDGGQGLVADRLAEVGVDRGESSTSTCNSASWRWRRAPAAASRWSGSGPPAPRR